jgi:hypothetical protein
MFKWIDKIVERYIEKKVIKANWWLTSEDKKHLKKYGKDTRLIGILDKIASSNIYTSMTHNTQEKIAERNGWVKCIGYLKSAMTKTEDKKNINYLTGETLDKK